VQLAAKDGGELQVGFLLMISRAAARTYSMSAVFAYCCFLNFGLTDGGSLSSLLFFLCQESNGREACQGQNQFLLLQAYVKDHCDVYVQAEAVLFYSQHPDGAVDRASMHGGCPVLEVFHAGGSD
jgi:hypothetical protein